MARLWVTPHCPERELILKNEQHKRNQGDLVGKGRESEMWSERRILKFTLHGDDGKGINDCQDQFLARRWWPWDLLHFIEMMTYLFHWESGSTQKTTLLSHPGATPSCNSPFVFSFSHYGGKEPSPLTCGPSICPRGLPSHPLPLWGSPPVTSLLPFCVIIIISSSSTGPVHKFRALGGRRGSSAQSAG